MQLNQLLVVIDPTSKDSNPHWNVRHGSLSVLNQPLNC